MSKNVALSPSSISLFMDCPRCFWRHMNLGVRRPSGAFPSLPAGMDRVLKEHFDQHRNSGKLPPELNDFEGQLFQDMEKLRDWRNKRRGLRYMDASIGISLMGALDDLFVTQEGRHAPLDFKTRGYPRKPDTHEHYQHQMDIYSFLLERNGMIPADFAILIFYHPIRVNEKHNVEFHPDAIKVKVNRTRGERLFMDAVECLMLEEEPEASEGCEWCGTDNK